MLSRKQPWSIVASNANLLEFAKSLLVGSAPKPLICQRKRCGCAGSLRFVPAQTSRNSAFASARVE